jgi:mannitol-1-phosphate/altronate dehydrogenase
MTPTDIAKEAIQRINKRITNIVFLEIQNDRELMQEYLRCVVDKGLETTNQQIGKEVKQSYNLVNANERENDPSCTLIQSHQIFE